MMKMGMRCSRVWSSADHMANAFSKGAVLCRVPNYYRHNPCHRGNAVSVVQCDVASKRDAWQLLNKGLKTDVDCDKMELGLLMKAA